MFDVYKFSHPLLLKNMPALLLFTFHQFHRTILQLHPQLVFKFTLQRHINLKKQFHDLKILLIPAVLDKTVNSLLPVMQLV